MSIERTDLIFAAWMIWLALAIVIGLYAGRDRWWELAHPRKGDPTVALRLGATVVLLFFVWIWVQVGVTNALHGVEGMFAGDKPTARAMAILTVVAPAGPLVVGLLLVRRRDLREAVGLTVRRGSVNVLWGVLGAVVAVPITLLVLQATLRALDAMGIDHPSKHPILDEFDRTPELWVRVLFAVGAVVVTPLFEELVFRGLLQTALSRLARRAWVGILISSLLFALVHPGWSQPAIFALSIIIGIVYAFSGSLWSAVLVHAIFNAFSMATSR